MKFRKLYTAVLLLAAACGCSRMESGDEGFYEFALTASAGDPETRTAYENDRIFSWTAGDRISVLFSNGSTDRFFTLTTEDSGATATFKGLIESGYTLGAADGKKWALYPAAEHSYTNGIVYFNQPATVDFTGSGFSANIPLAALGDGGSYVFKPACSVVKFSFTDIDAATVQFRVTAQNTHALSGTFPCKEGGYCLYWQPQWAAEGTSSITFIENVTGGTAEFYVPIPGWDAAKFIPIITLSDYDSGKVIYTATARNGFPSNTTASLGHIIVVSPIQCGGGGGGGSEGMVSVTYTESSDDFFNPERGFYSGKSFHSESNSPLSKTTAQSARLNGRSLMLLEFYLEEFIDSDISSKYLTLVENSLKALRDGGIKCILRFAYKNNHNEDDHPWDATEAQVLRHITQLKPLLQSYSDVIFVMQAGFVGSWGEWYYTDNFVQNPSTDADYLPRKHVLEALLDALPADRQIQLRTPVFKTKLLGLSWTDTITEATAHNGSAVSRVGGHNDCFVASSGDQGTFHNNNERNFWKADSKYTIMGGETCAVSDYCHCASSGSIPGAISELESYHWTYLNMSYNTSVLNIWKSEDCYEEASRRLGYRLVLNEASFTGSPVAGGTMDVVLKLQNKGFAAPMNPRGAYLVLSSATGSELGRWELGSDPRTWQPDKGEITVSKTITLPSSASGPVSLSLSLPDGSDSLKDNVNYSIRLANDDVWDQAKGLNKLYSFTL